MIKLCQLITTLFSFFSSLETSTPVYSTHLDPKVRGPAVEAIFQETGASPVLAYSTTLGFVVGVDLRMKGEAYKLENGQQCGTRERDR